MGWWERANQLWSLRGSWGRIELGQGVTVRGRIIFRGKGKVLVGAGVRMDARQSPIVLKARYENAEILIGDGVIIEGGVSIEANASVRIGANTHIGAFAMLLDNHFHQLEGDRSVSPQSQPVVLEEDVEIGPRAILLPGAHVGRGTRVGPGSVLSRRTPPGVVVIGNPASVRPKGE